MLRLLVSVAVLVCVAVLVVPLFSLLTMTRKETNCQCNILSEYVFLNLEWQEHLGQDISHFLGLSLLVWREVFLFSAFPFARFIYLFPLIPRTGHHESTCCSEGRCSKPGAWCLALILPSQPNWRSLLFVSCVLRPC